MTKKLLIAGAGKGIGRAVARLALEKDYKVLAVSRTKEGSPIARFWPPRLLDGIITKETRVNYDYPYLTIDLSQPESAITLASYAKDVGAVINCTGTHPGMKTFSQQEKFAGETMEIIQQNVLPATHLYQAFLSAFRERKQGHFVHISSGALDFYDPSEAGYCASKSALEAVVLSLQNEDKEKETGVLHHAVRVALTDTPLARKVCPDIKEEEWETHYTARETAAYLLDIVLRPENYPKPIVPLLYKPVRL